MNKKFCKTLGLAILLASSLPFSLVSAETVEEVPTGETTISSMADDPLKEYKERAANQVSSIEEPESEPKKEAETKTTEDTPTTESSAEDTPDTEEKAKRQPRGGGGITPFSTTLIEGVDIDANLATLLRNGSQGNGIYDVTRPSFTGHGKPENGLTDDDLATLSYLNVNMKGLTSLKGLEYAINLETLSCSVNSLTSLDISQFTELKDLMCGSNSLTSLNSTNNSKLERLSCEYNSISTLDISQNLKLKNLNFANNLVSIIDISQHIELAVLNCEENPINDLDITSNKNLASLACGVTNITNLDVSKNPKLDFLSVRQNVLDNVDITQNLELTYLWCSDSNLKSLDVTKNEKLETLNCDKNFFKELDLTQNTKLKTLNCSMNDLNELNLSQNIQLTTLDCSENHLRDITSTYGLSNLTSMNAEKQEISIPIPTISSNQLTVDVLRTTAHQGLSIWNLTIPGPPILSVNGDNIELSNVTRESLDGSRLGFSYNGSQLTEGAISGTKKFSGEIRFFIASELLSNIQPKEKKVKSGEEIQWTWTIMCTTEKKSENIHASVSLPSALIIDPSSIEKDGSLVTINDINGTNSLGDLGKGESISFTFKTIATGAVDEWLEAIGRLDWEDDTIASPYHSEGKGRVQIQDDEQTYTPKDTDDMSIQSVPVYFNHGTNPIMSTAQTYHLHSMNYQSNTKVVTDGFYTRIKDDRAISTGWKLTAKLSDFRDSSNTPMPNGTGTSLKLENMSIERVTDRDTPQETIDPSPTGVDVPSSVQSTETIVAGQSTAKTLVKAQPNQGQDTWQLRMPFDKISLNVPANAGKKGTVYKAKLTWSLDDTP